MATKWKNTVETKVKKIAKAIFTKTGRDIIASVIFGIVAVIFFYAMYQGTGWLNTGITWILGLWGNFFLGLTSALIYRLCLNITYANTNQMNHPWQTEETAQPKQPVYTYENWRQFYHRQQLFCCITECVLLFISFLIFRWIVDYTRDWYPGNYASGYTTFFTAIWLFAVCEWTLYRFMRRQLDVVMAKTRENNQKIVDAAMESQKESIAAAIKSEKLKVDLISNVSHDLKTPLTSMVGYIDLLKKEDLNDTAADYVEVLSTKAQKLKEMIESLFSLAKTSSGNIELKPEPLNLNRLIEQIYADMEDKITASGLEFVTELTAADTELVTDSSYLYRICQNLIENALKYSALHTRVFLKTSSTPTEQGRLIRFEITNTSAYRMDFTKEQIVERFARGDKARSSEGNGLGLAIVSTYTSALGGRFDVFIDCDQFKAIVEFEKAAEQNKTAVVDVEKHTGGNSLL